MTSKRVLKNATDSIHVRHVIESAEKVFYRGLHGAELE